MEYFKNLWTEFSLVSNITKLQLALTVIIILVSGATGSFLPCLLGFVLLLIEISETKDEINEKKLELSK